MGVFEVQREPSLVPDVQVSDKVHNLVSNEVLTNQQFYPVDDLLSEGFTGLDIEEQVLTLDVLKPIVLDEPFINENFNFPGFNDLKTFEPLMENQFVSKCSDFSLCGLGFVSPMKDYFSKAKGYFLISCSKNVVTGVVNKAQPGVLMGTNHRVFVLHKMDPISMEHQSGALRAAKSLSRVSP